MTELNRAILGRRCAPERFALALNERLADLPEAESFTPLSAQRMVVLLGLAGASLGRHYQERDPAHRATPERAFDGVRVGAARTPFRAYFARLAERTGTGHCERDTYASLVRWNLPETQLRWAGRVVAVLPGVFQGSGVHTYTGTVEEARFLGLLKLSETLELGVNTTLLPLLDEAVDLSGDEALHRVATAVIFLDGLRRLNGLFAALPAAESLSSHYFLDVFRQYAVRWVAGDIPPSGALDPEAIGRDVLLGIDSPGYEEHVRRLFPALLDDERARITELLAGPSLPALVLGKLGLEAGLQEDVSRARLSALATDYPIVAALALLLQAHARFSGVHLMMTKKFLFNPQRTRDHVGFGDPGVVSNRRGTTGMDERYLQDLTRARQHHPLAAFRRVPAAELASACGLNRVRQEGSEELSDLVQYTPVHGSGSVSIRPRFAIEGHVDTTTPTSHGNDE
jgi:hypothetical protein